MKYQSCLLNYPEIIELLRADKIVIVDGGARGEIFSPFDRVDTEVWHAYRFEPDPGAEIISSSQSTVIPKALWKQEATIPIHIAKSPSSSSVYPFNRSLQEEIDPHILGRTVDKVVEVEAIRIDSVFPNQQHPQVDFIKLDVHGCEYEILEGSQQQLHSCLGLLVENWVIPIHKGQKTRADVEQFLNQSQFYLFEQYDVAKWARMPDSFTKTQAIAVDSLYFPHLISDSHRLTSIQALKQLGICELFEHYGYTWQLADYFYKSGILEETLYRLVIKHLEKKQKSQGKRRVLQKIVNRIEASLCAFST